MEEVWRPFSNPPYHGPMGSSGLPSGDVDTITFDELEKILDELEALQNGKVFSLARRLKPGLTLEDIRNPHDFPELEDNDWHYEDGTLTGIQSVIVAIRRIRNERQDRAGKATDAT